MKNKLFFLINHFQISNSELFESIITQSQFEELYIAEDKPWLINIHLEWDGRLANDNYGFEIAQQIRLRKKSNGPIIFYSPIKKDYFEFLSKSDFKYYLLFGMSNGFVQLPLNLPNVLSQFQSLGNLSDLGLLDESLMLCDIKGLILDKLSHNLKLNSNYTEVLVEAKQLLTARQLADIEFDEFEIKFKDIAEKDFDKLKEKLIENCTRELSPNLIEKEKLSQVKKYKVLVIDDVQSYLDRICLDLSDRFDFVFVNSFLEAKEELDKDIFIKIIAVVSDWRLYRDVEQTYLQPKQGYDILEYASNLGCRSLIALTSESDYLVHQIRNKAKFNFSVFKKEYLSTESQFQIFGDALCSYCEISERARISFMDEFAIWNFPSEKGILYRDEYIKIWNSSESHNFWNSVYENAEFCIKQIDGGRRKLDDLSYTVSNKTRNLNNFFVIRLVIFYYWLESYPNKPMNKIDLSSYKSEVLDKLYEDRSSNSQVFNNVGIKQNKVNKNFMFIEEKQWLKAKNVLDLFEEV